MSSKNWLEQGWYIEKQIRILNKKKSRLYDDLTRITSSYMPNYGKGNSSNDKSLKQAIYIDYENEIRHKTEELYNKKLEIESVINQVQTRKYRDVLTMRYILFMVWEDVAEELGVSVRHIYRLHETALNIVSRYIKNDEG